MAKGYVSSISAIFHSLSHSLTLLVPSPHICNLSPFLHPDHSLFHPRDPPQTQKASSVATLSPFLSSWSGSTMLYLVQGCGFFPVIFFFFCLLFFYCHYINDLYNTHTHSELCLAARPHPSQKPTTLMVECSENNLAGFNLFNYSPKVNFLLK